MSWWDEQIAARLPPGPVVVVPTTLYPDVPRRHLMALAQPDHDPFAPHEEVELGFPADWKSPELHLSGGDLAQPMGRRVPSEELNPLGPHDGMLEDGDPALGVMELTGSGEPVVVIEPGIPADGEDHDPTPDPGPGKRTRGKRGAPKRSAARAQKLAEELGE